MTENQILINQTDDVYKWTDKLIGSIPYDKWDIMPNVIETTLTWQVGHLIVSHYFHSIWVIKGHQMDILQSLPLKEYGELFTKNSPKASIGMFSPQDLLKHLKTVQQKSIAIVSGLSQTDFESILEPTPIPHPIVKTKLEAIDWNIKHTMYHCGQVGIVRRIVDKQFDFGLAL